MPKPLTHRQAVFAKLMLNAPTATAAALGAGYAAPSARFQASRLLAVPAVRQRIADLRQQREDLRRAPDILFARGCASRVKSAVARGDFVEARRIVGLYVARQGLTPMCGSGTK